jgi:hypothetical protein
MQAGDWMKGLCNMVNELGYVAPESPCDVMQSLTESDWCSSQ